MTAPQPLAGLTVLDLGQMYNGSYCGMLMGLHGARVIKLEPPGGEALRQRGGSAGAHLPFYLVNSGKEAIVVNLKQPEGKQLFLELIDKCDVVIENYAPGTMRKLGLDAAELTARNPRLIYASSTGYGTGGRYSNYPAMDLTIQAMTGTMATTGTPESGPLKTGPAGADFLAGVHLLSAVLLAIIQRGVTGKGQVVEVAMADAVIPSLASSIAYLLGLGKEPLRTGNRHSGLAYAPYNVYPTADGGFVALFCVRDEHWASLCAVMDAPELRTDPRFATVPARTANMAETDRVVGDWIAARDRTSVFDKLLQHGVPSAPVLSISEVVTDPHFLERGSLVQIDHPVVGPIVVPGSPMRLGETEALQPRAARELGQDTEQVLRELLGLSDSDILRLRADGIIGSSEADKKPVIQQA